MNVSTAVAHYVTNREELEILAKSLGYNLESELGINNPLLDADSYKASHGVQYPPDTEYVYSYIESRGGDYDKTVFVGLQMFCKKYLSRPITKAQIDEAEREWNAHGEPFNRTVWDYIVNELDGKLPLEIRAVPEGTVIEGKNALLTIVNTDPKCASIVSFFETALLRAIWYPTTVATNSYRCKQVIKQYYDLTSDDPNAAISIMFKLHDFGARGTSSKESAGIGGIGHLLNFMGTDTMTAIQYAKQYYNEPMAGFSIPAGEHSTVTTWGRNNEVGYLKNLIAKFGKPGALFACPIDSYDTWTFIDKVLGDCIEDLKATGATYVVRPDSGDPLTNPIKVIERLGELYGYTTNSKGYKLLPAYLRVIQGDGINIESLPIICFNLMKAGWSIDNLAFGMGGGLLQHVNRDTFKFAMKASAAYIDGKWIDVFKSPIDQPDKASKRGRLMVVKGVDGKFKTFSAVEYELLTEGILQVVWKNGELVRDESFATMRERCK